MPVINHSHHDRCNPSGATVADASRPRPPHDVMLEKAKDLALLWLRRQLDRLDLEVAAFEERGAAVTA